MNDVYFDKILLIWFRGSKKLNYEFAFLFFYIYQFALNTNLEIFHKQKTSIKELCKLH